MLVSSPATCSHSSIFMAVKELITQLLSTKSGLLYLSSRHDHVNGLVRALTQDHGLEEGSEETGFHALGLEMIYRLQTMQLIDQLMEFHLKGMYL